MSKKKKKKKNLTINECHYHPGCLSGRRRGTLNCCFCWCSEGPFRHRRLSSRSDATRAVTGRAKAVAAAAALLCLWKCQSGPHLPHLSLPSKAPISGAYPQGWLWTPLVSECWEDGMSPWSALLAPVHFAQCCWESSIRGLVGNTSTEKTLIYGCLLCLTLVSGIILHKGCTGWGC